MSRAPRRHDRTKRRARRLHSVVSRRTMHLKFKLSSNSAQLPHQSQKVEFAPGFSNLVSGDSVNHDAGKFNSPTSGRNALKFASVRAASRDPQHYAVVFGDHFLNGVEGIRKGMRECAFSSFELSDVQIRVAQVADVVGGDELVESAGEACISERDPTANQLFVLLSLHAGFVPINSDLSAAERLTLCTIRRRNKLEARTAGIESTCRGARNACDETLARAARHL